MEELKDTFGFEQIGEAVFTEFTQLRPGGSASRASVAPSPRAESAPMTNREQPGRPVQQRSLVLLVMHHRFASMQGHTHAQRPDLTPLFGKQRTLGIEGSGDGVRSSGKSRLHCIADGLEEDATIGLDCGAE